MSGQVWVVAFKSPTGKVHRKQLVLKTCDSDEAALACGMLRVDTMRAALALLGRAGLARRCGGGAWESTAGEDVVRDAFGLVSGEGPLGRLLDAGAAR